jgi:hypothetical protein
MELINAITTFSIGAFLVLGISYQLVRVGNAPDTAVQQRGRRVQDLVNVFLWMTLAGFLFVLVCAAADRAGFFKSPDPVCNSYPNTVCSIYGIQWLLTSKQEAIVLDPLHIYAGSAARIIPFLVPVLIPALRVGLNVAADVLLYILPPGFALSLQRKSQERFRALLSHLHARHRDTNILVLAHSQGTVIAYDVLRKKSWQIGRFVTVGSPLGSLYRRFLGRAIEALPNCEWINVYRLSDYIAGPISNRACVDHIQNTQYRFAHFRYCENGDISRVVTNAEKGQHL